MSGQRFDRTAGGVAGLAIRRPLGTLAIASVVVVLGLLLVGRLPIDLLPTVEYPHIRVTVNYPGAAPEVMEEQVTRVLERNLAATENLIRITGRASEGRTNVDLHFAYGTNLDIAMQDASRYLELARTQLPAGIQPPRLYKFDPSQDPVWQAGLSSSVRSEAEISDWALHRLTPQLLAIEGVAAVEAAGGQTREIQVLADQERLAAHGLGLDDIASALAAQNLDIAAGWVTSAEFDVMSKIDGRFTSVDEVRATLLQLPDGKRLRLDAVAEVRDGHAEQRLFVRLDGVPAAQLAIYKLPVANTVQVVDRINESVERLRRSGFIPEDIVLQPTRDPAHFIRGALTAVSAAALLGGGLAMLAVVLFLGSLRKSLIIGLSIPLALLATFALMGGAGLTLNIISLGGLALGVGLLLDNAIVMLESIFRRRDGDDDPATQAAIGAQEVQTAIIAGTLTNLAAVLPFLLVTGLAAMLFRELILTLSFAIFATLAAALSLVPTLSALLARVPWRSGLGESRPLRAFARGIAALRKRYLWLLVRVLRRAWLAPMAALALMLLALLAASGLGREFLPLVDDGNVHVRLSLPPGSPPAVTDGAARQVEQALRQLPHIESTFTLVGGHLGGGVVNERSGTANVRVQLVPADQRPQMDAGTWVAHAQETLDALTIPGARIRVSPPSIQGLRIGAGGGDLEITVVGEDLDELMRVAREVGGRLHGIRGLEGVEIGREERSPLMRVHIDRERAAALGLDVAVIGRAVRRAVSGEVVTRYADRGQQYDLRLRLPREAAADAQALGNLLLPRADGAAVRLRDVASFEVSDAPAHIERENQNRIVRVTGAINTALADVGSVMSTVESRLVGLPLPDRYSLVFGGQWQTIEESQRELGIVIGLAAFLVLVVLVAQYERIGGPLVIMSSAPIALAGAAFALWLTDTPLSAPAMIGVVLLVGIVVNNSILLVEHIERRRSAGLGLGTALVSAGRVRLRPILMTTLTTVLGMLPLAIGLGEGSEIMRPLALSVVGGLLLATLVTLFLVPSLYALMARAGRAGRLRLGLTEVSDRAPMVT